MDRVALSELVARLAGPRSGSVNERNLRAAGAVWIQSGQFCCIAQRKAARFASCVLAFLTPAVHSASKHMRFVPVSANGRPAVARTSENGFVAAAISTLGVRDGQIVSITRFTDPALLPRFGLALRLPEGAADVSPIGLDVRMRAWLETLSSYDDRDIAACATAALALQRQLSASPAGADRCAHACHYLELVELLVTRDPTSAPLSHRDEPVTPSRPRWSRKQGG